MRGISKSFGAQRALDHVDFELRGGEVHILAGENGAGKSTLIKILGGVHQPDDGQILIDGRARRFVTPRQATAGGVAIIHQELSLVPELNVADNLFLGRETARLGWLNRRRQHAAAARALLPLNLTIDVRRQMGNYSIAVQQLVEIAKALLLDARIIVMDEPTSALREPEVRALFACIADLTRRGCGVVYITHKLEEVYQIADRITVLRDGRWIVTGTAEHIPAPALVHHMVGRDDPLAAPPPAPAAASTPRYGQAPCADPPTLDPTVDHPRLHVRQLTLRPGRRTARPLFENVSLTLRGGEIVGLAGLEGSGNSALLHALFGDFAGRLSGAMELDGAGYRAADVQTAIRRGLALVTSDRQRSGLVLPMTVADNIALASLPRLSPSGWVRARRVRSLVDSSAAALDLRAASWRLPVSALSGGNQQKVALGKWMVTRPRVLLLDEPTRGVDVGAKQEIYSLMRRWAAAGTAILLITSELPELLALIDRVLVMHRGKIVTELARSQATPESIIQAAMGAA